MLEYTGLRRERRRFLALPGLTFREFHSLLSAFVEAYQRRYASGRTLAGRKRKRRIGGGRRGKVVTAEQKLLFIVVSQKTYPLQIVMGELFGLSQSGPNHLPVRHTQTGGIHRLLPVLRDALTTLGVMPERDGGRFARAERRYPEPQDYSLEGTARRRQRPKKPEKQGWYSSGKKTAHSDKNGIVVNPQSKRVGDLSPTSAGKTPDKKVADRERIAYPRQAILPVCV